MVNDDIYVVTDWIDGRECDFKKEEDLLEASETLARFHLCARNFMPDDNVKARNDIGKLPYNMEKRMMTLNKMRDIARKNNKKTEFDMLYLSNIEFYLNLSRQAVNFLNLDSYSKVCSLALTDNVLCHHDYTYHNILFDNEHNSYIVDFEYCKSEIQIHDVATLIIKSLKRLNWDIRYAEMILERYNSINPLKYDDYNVLKTLLIFPQRFWRLANRYYYKEASWGEDTFIKKMKEIIQERSNYMKFIGELEELKI
jgi:CotS family spore coat protein